jgi:ABC-type nickel/cobalt efflux system permease component RcnA
MWQDILSFLVHVQGAIRDSIGADLRVFAASRDWSTLIAVLPLGIAFGAVHALTPGHSKTVLATYLVGAPLKVLEGVGVAAVLAFTHVLTAVLIAVLALPLIETGLTSAGRAPLLEDVSRGLLALIGVWMLVRAWRGPSEHHAEGAFVGIMAGLIPCPLTLFAMVLAISRGVPEAGLVFAGALMLGVMTTLSAVAVAAILAKDSFTRLLGRHGAKLQRVSRVIEAGAGVVLVVIGLQEVLLR